MVAFLRFIVSVLVVSFSASASAFGTYSIAEGQFHDVSTVAADLVNIPSGKDEIWIPSTNVAQESTSPHGDKREPGPVALTREPEMLPETGAAASLWPVFIALFIVAGYLAYDTYRSDVLSK